MSLFDRFRGVIHRLFGFLRGSVRQAPAPAAPAGAIGTAPGPGSARRPAEANRPFVGLEPLEPRLLLSVDIAALDHLTDPEEETGALEAPALLAEDFEPAAVESTQPVASNAAFEPERPLLLVPGIMGTFATTEFAEEWFTTRGIAPELPDPDHDGDGEPDMLPTIETEPLAGTYDDMLATFENVGYDRGETLFTVDYDWRLQPGPAPELDNGESFDGALSVGGAEGITDDVFRYAVDYMGYYLEQAVEAWESLQGETPESVDLVTHSTGGLVARAYMQSDAYGDVFDAENDRALPEVNDLSMIGVPNRGASKAWNPLLDNFASDPQYQFLVSKIGYQAFTMLADQDNDIDQIDGPAGETITLQDVTDDDGEPDGAAFIGKYVPTVQSLLATYEFLIDSDSTGDQPRHINDDAEFEHLRNDVLLNLNAGLDADWALDDAFNGDENDPSPFLDALADGGEAQIIYSTDQDTITLVEEHTGDTSDGFLPPIVPMDDYYGRVPEADEVWYDDLYMPDGKDNGDGTVPIESAAGQFLVDPRVIEAGEEHDESTRGVLHRINPRDDFPTDHSGLMSNPDVHRVVLNRIVGEGNYSDDDIAQDQGLSASESLEAILNRGVYDHMLELEDLELVEFDSIAPVEELSDALDWLADQAAEIDQTDLLSDTPIDALGRPLGEWISFEDMIVTQLVDPLESVLEAPGEQTVWEVTEEIARLAQAVGHIAPAAWAQVQEEGGVAQRVPLRSGGTVTDEDLDLTALQSQLPGLHLDAQADLQVRWDAAMELGIGMDGAEGVDTADRVYFQPGPLELSLTLVLDDVDLAVSAGLLDVGIDGGRLRITPELDLAWDVPQGMDRITLGDMTGGTHELVGMLNAEPGGSVFVDLPIQASAGAFTAPDDTRVTLTSDDPFDPEAYELTTVDFDDLLPLTRVTPDDLLVIVRDMADGFGWFNQGALLDLELPFANDRTVGDVVDFAQSLREAVLSPLTDEDGVPTFNSIDEMASILAGVSGNDDDNGDVDSIHPASANAAEDLNLDYDPTGEQLSFDLGWEHMFDPDTVRLALAVDAGPLGEISSATMVDVLAEAVGGATFNIGLEEQSVILEAAGTGPTDGQLTEDATFTLRLDDGDPVDITLDAQDTQGHQSFDDLVDAIDDALAATELGDRVTAQKADDEDRLVLVTDDAAAMFLEAEADDPAVTELGLAGFESASAVRSELVTIENAHLDASVGIEVADATGWASIGLLEVGIENGTGSLDAEVGGLLKHPNDPDDLDDPQDASPVGLLELADHARTDPQSVFTGPNFAGQAALELPVFADSAVFEDEPAGDPRVVLDWADISELDPAEADGPQFSFEDMDALLAFEDLGFDDVVSLLSEFGDFLGDQAATFSFLDRNIPVIDLSVADLLDLAETFSERVTELEDEAVDTLDELATEIDEAMGLSPGTVGLGLEDDGLLRIDFDFAHTVAEEVALDLDLASLAEGVAGLENLSSLADVSGAAEVSVDIDAVLGFSAGFDLHASTPAPVVFSDTGIAIDLDLSASDINAEVMLLSLPLGIVDGSAGLTADPGQVNGEPAPMLRLGLDDAETHYALGDVAGELELDTAPVQVHATLPLSFLDVLDPAEDRIELEVENVFSADPDVTLTGPDLEQVIADFDITRNLGALIDGFDALLAAVHDGLSSSVLDRDLPLVGTNLADAADFIDTIREDALAELRDRIGPDTADAVDLAEEALLAALGDDGLGILDENDITTAEETEDGVVNEITFELDLDATVDVFTADVDFDIGIPALGLDVDGTVDVGMGLDWTLGFGLNRDEGFFLATGEEHALDVGLDASIDGFEAAGSLAFLRLEAADSATDPSQLDVGLTVGLDDADGTGRLHFDQRDELADRLAPTLDGTAAVNLDLTLDFGADADFPSLEATLHAGWSFDDGDMTGDPPVIGFENVRIDAGAFVERFAAPILERIEQAIAPFQPIIDVVTTPVPILSDVAGEDITLLDIASHVEGTFLEAAESLIGIMDTVGDVVDSIDEDAMIDLGGFTIDPDENVHEQTDLTGIDLSQQQDVDLAADPLGAFEDLSTEAEEFIEDVQAEVVRGDGDGLEFPLLSDPLQGLSLLLGQDVDLFTYDMPSLEVDLSFSRRFGPFLTVGPASLWARFEAAMDAVVDLELGYDTRGFREWRATGDPGDVINGFFAVTENDPMGNAATRAAITGSIVAGPVFELGLARAGVDGGLAATVEATLRDPGEVGRVYADQILRRAEFGWMCALEGTGEVSGVLDAYLTLGVGPASTTVDYNLAETTLVSFEGDDQHCYPNRFAPNDTRDEAADLGTGPGIHVRGDSISDNNDVDWYRFSLLESDTVDVRADFLDPVGNTLEVYDADGNLIQRKAGEREDLVVTLADAEPGEYYVQVYGNQNRYELSVTPGAASDTDVYYVNPVEADNSPDDQAFNAWADLYHTLAPGDDAHEGVSPHAPVASVAGLDAQMLEPGDIVVVDTGNHQTPVTLDTDYDAVTFVGSVGGATHSAGGDPAWLLKGTSDATLHGIELTGGADIRLEGDAEGNVIHENTGGRIVLAGGQDNLVFDNTDTAVVVEAGAHGEIYHNQIENVSEAIRIDADADVETRVFENEVVNATTGIRNDSGEIALVDNVIRDGGTGLRGDGLLGSDEAHTANVIHGNTTGVLVDAGSAVVQFNEIHDNTTGIQAASNEPATIVDNHVFENQTGIAGGPVIGGTDWSRPNRVHHNDVGINAGTDAEVRFNRLGHNATGIEAGSGSLIAHNVVYHSEDIDIAVHGHEDVRILNNTLHAVGDGGVEVGSNGEVFRRGVNVADGSADVQLRNNIIHAEDGYGLWVEPDSQVGFDSDYNNLFASGDGAPVWYQKPFNDLYDWQVEANQDNASIGYTAPHPDRDDPLFRDAGDHDYRLTDLDSTSINAGDPASDFSNEPAPNGERINLGAYGNTGEAATSPEAYIALRYPEFHVDWQADEGRPILWDAHNVDGQVRLEVYREGDGLVDEIATVDADQGQYIWSPHASDITGDADERYRIHVVDIADDAVAVESRETFAVLGPTDSYYVNDAETADTEYTSAPGDNRNPGISAEAPKASVLAMLRNHQLGPDDTIHVDAGDYVHVRSVTLEGRHGGVHILGTEDADNPARIDRGSPADDRNVFELAGAGFVTIENLHLTGGERGIHVPDDAGSNELAAIGNVLTGHALEAVRVGSGNEGVRFEDNIITDNAGQGIRLDGESATIANNEVRENAGAGVFLDGRDHSVIGNIIELNDGPGVAFSSGGDAGRGSHLSENLIQQNQGHGIEVLGLGSRPQNLVISHNELRDHDIGGLIVDGGNALIEYNRVHGNDSYGMRLEHSSAVARGNEVYDNPIGLDVISADLLENNLLYANSDHGVRLTDAGGVTLNNNTLYQPEGDAIGIDGISPGTTLRNNIVVVADGHALDVDEDSQAGFNSDHNLFHVEGSGTLGAWQGDRDTLAAWQQATFGDRNSIEADPLFVNVEGGDFADWDFHLQSEEGSFHGGALAPVFDESAGEMVTPDGDWVADANHSPAIARGDGEFDNADEPAPHGGFINLGAFGGTAQASQAEPAHLELVNPVGEAVWLADRAFTIEWRTHDDAGTVTLELIEAGESEPTLTIADEADNTGSFSWSVPDDLDPGEYLVRIERTDGLTDITADPITIHEPAEDFYVNDDTVLADGLTTTAGDLAHDGLSPDTPIASLNALLSRYPLGDGDTVHLDAGEYAMTRSVMLDAAQSGLTIRGFEDPADAGDVAVLDRMNTSRPVFEITGAADLTLEHLHLTGGARGIDVLSESESHGLLVREVTMQENALGGLRIGAGNDDAVIEDSRVLENDGVGMHLGADGVTVTGNQISANVSSGVHLDGQNNLIADNVISQTQGDGVSFSFSSGAGRGSQITGNLIHENTGWGVSASSFGSNPGDVVISQNVISNQGQGGIIANGENALIVHNRIAANGQTGLQVNDSSIVVRANEVYGHTWGVNVSSAERVENNLVHNNNQIGIFVSSSDGVALNNNTVHQSSFSAVWIGSQAADVSLRNNIIATDTAYALRVDANSQAGFDSDYNLFHVASPTAALGEWQGDRADLAAWQNAAVSDANSLEADPLFVDAPAGDPADWDFHLQSETGSFHGGALAPIVDVSTGEIVMPEGEWHDDDANHSPAIARGDRGFDVADEPTPHGERINLGAFGGTEQASQAQEEFLELERPRDGAVWLADRTFTIEWRTHDAEDTVTLELIEQGETDPALTIAEDAANAGEFAWAIPDDLDPGEYLVRIEREDGLSDTMNDPFTIHEPVSDFYVNDGTVVGDGLTTAPGDNANHGLSDDAPVASIHALLTRYPLGEDDTIHIDAGDHALTQTIRLEAAHSGLTIRGFEDPADAGDASIFDRMNSNRPVFEIAGAVDVTLEHLHLTGGGRGIHVPSGAGSHGLEVRDSAIFANIGVGIRVDAGSDDVRLENNRVFDNNGTGIHLAGEQVSVLGNEITDNSGAGVYIDGRDHEVTGNVITLNQGTGVLFDTSAGSSGGGSEVTENFIHDNAERGIDITGFSPPQDVLLSRNEVSEHPEGGIAVEAAEAVVTFNRVHANEEFGIRLDHDSAEARGNEVYANPIGIDALRAAHVANNLVYANAEAGIVVGSGDLTLHNNTVHQATGEALDITAGSPNVTLRNNILVAAEDGHALRVAPSSQAGFDSDHNLFHAAGDAVLGDWEGDRDGIGAWRHATFDERNSIEADPLFVNVEGGDFADWDFHLQSEEGSFHGGALAPVFDESAGEMVMPDGDWVADANHSPAIARGDGEFDNADEPDPHGGFINLGAFGGTEQASHAMPEADEFITLSSPVGGELWRADRTFTISWRSHDAEGDVTLELLEEGETEASFTIADDADNTGTFSWAIPADIEPGEYLLRIERDDDLTDVTADPLTIHEPVEDFYVNDATVLADGLTTAAGDDAHDGLSPDAPVTSISTLLSRYQLGEDDTIHVDAGVYDLTTPVQLRSMHSGLTIRGHLGLEAEGEQRTLLDRSNPHRPVFEILGATDVTLADLHMTGGGLGIHVPHEANSHGLEVRGNTIFDMDGTGIHVGEGNDQLVVAGNVIHDNASHGIYTEGAEGAIHGNEIHDNTGAGITIRSVEGIHVWNNQLHENVQAGIQASHSQATDVLIESNEVRNHLRGVGISVQSDDAVVRANTVSAAETGIRLNGGAVAEHNRVFDHVETGIVLSDSDAEARSNAVYGNRVGITVDGGARVESNIIYANTERGVLVADADGVALSNNTVYQIAGDALRFAEGSAAGSAHNNILIVEAGYALRVGAESAEDFTSDHNLFHLDGTQAHAGHWTGEAAASLDTWRAASGADAEGLAADPLLVDPSGLDNVLGLAFLEGIVLPPGLEASAQFRMLETGLAYHGGADDRFDITDESPAIDRGHTWAAPPLDRHEFERRDDPATVNQGGDRYIAHDLGESQFVEAGQAQDWTSSSGTWELELPFAFSFYGQAHEEVIVSSNGFLDFSDSSSADADNSTAALTDNPRIAPLWTDLTTSSGDIYVDDSQDGQVAVRWDAQTADDQTPANVAVVLFEDGTIRFDYGPGNTGLEEPTVGLSMGNERWYQLATHDGASNLDGADSIEFRLEPGIVDIGAHEFTDPSVHPANVVANPNFAAGTLAPWQRGGEGTVETTTAFEQLWARLTADPDATLSQRITLPEAATTLEFRTLFEDGGGELSVTLDGQPLDSIPAPATPDAAPSDHVIDIDDPDLLGSEVELEFTFAGDAGESALLGDVSVIDPALAHPEARLFYNDSALDGHDAAPGAHNDAAIDLTTQALAPGEVAELDELASHSNYIHGINGLFIDLPEVADADTIGDELTFRIGNSDDPGTWQQAPAPAHLNVREGDGIGGNHRIEVIWDHHQIADTWLEIVVSAGENTALEEAAVFYFGHRTADVTGDGQLTDDDIDAIRANQTGFGAAGMENPYDIARSGRVDLGDVISARNAHAVDQGVELQAIAPPETSNSNDSTESAVPAVESTEPTASASASATPMLHPATNGSGRFDALAALGQHGATNGHSPSMFHWLDNDPFARQTSFGFVDRLELDSRLDTDNEDEDEEEENGILSSGDDAMVRIL